MHRVVEVIAAVAVGAVGVVGLFSITGHRQEKAPTGIGSTTIETGTEVAPRVALEPTAFLDAWERSRTGPYAVTGTLERTQGELVETVGVRHARSDGRVLEQTGRTALVTSEAGQRSCEIFEDGDIGCARAVRAPTPADERAVLTAVVGPGGTHNVYPTDRPECYELIAMEAAPGSVFGLTTTLCFDPSTGAVSSLATTNGPDTHTVFQAISIDRLVENKDLEPRLG